MAFAVSGGNVQATETHDAGISWRSAQVGGDGAVSLGGGLKVGVKQFPMAIKGRFAADSFVGYFDASLFTPAGFLCIGDIVLARAGSAADRRLHAAIQPTEQPGDGLAQTAVAALNAPAPAQVAAAPTPAPAPVATPPRPSETVASAAPAERSPGPARPTDLKSQLTQLDDLRNAGLINDAEFETRKRALLDRNFGRVEPAPAAAAPTQKSASAAPVNPKIPAHIKFGNYHALVIGINKYQHLKPLKTAEIDAKGTAAILRERYGFTVKEMLNPTRSEIVDALDEFRGKLKFEDNLLIYFAGHGWLDEGSDQGYWLPADARPDRTSAWLSNATITEAVRAMEAKHVMVIADSCYSGRLVRGTEISLPMPEYLKKMSRKKARVVMTSGGLEPVLDADQSGHSPFTSAFLSALQENESVLDGNGLFNAIRRPVMVNASQTPQYSDIRNAGHDGGDFLFVRRN